MATIARSAVIYNHTFPNSNFNNPTSINANLTSAWTGIGDQPYSFSYDGNNAMALLAHNHVYVLTITIKEGYQVELTSIVFSRFSSDNATFQVLVDGVNYGASFSSNTSMTPITRTKTVSKLRNTMQIRIAVTNSTTPNNNYSAIDNFTLNGSVTSYDPAAEAKPDGNGILYVDGGVNIAGDGSSWNSPLKRMYFATRAAALNPNIKQVWVVNGEYKPEAANTPFTLTDGVAYYGGFEGYEEELRERSITNPSVLAGLGGAVITVSGAGPTTRLDGFLVTGGTGQSVSGERRGGALHATSSSLVIANCTFGENATDPSASAGKGGAIYLLNSSPLIVQCLFAGNSAKGTGSGRGGAIFLDNSSPVIRNCTFSANEVGGNAAAGNGGAIYALAGSSPVIENTIIWNNADAASPGGVSSVGGAGTPAASYSIIQGGFTGTSILDSDPQFTNPAESNFVQRKGSPATNAGNPATDISVFPKNPDDTPIGLDGNRRLTSQAIDLGPYEVTPSVIWYVNAASTLPDPSGDTWANALGSLGAALNLASEGDQIWVARGEYENSNQLSFIHGVKIYGSFLGTETALDQRPLPIAHGDPATATVLMSNVGPFIDNSYNDLTRDDVFDGFTITGVFGINGGAIRNVSASPTIANCAFLNNYGENGAAIYNESASPMIVNTLFRSNSASFGGGSGGAIANRDGSNVVLINCLLAGNSAGQFGGAIYNDGSTLTLLNCTVTGNSQAFQGAIVSTYGTLILRNTIVYGNGSGINSQENANSITYSLVEGMNASDADHNLDGTTNPQFAGTDNWTLLPCSPAINRGSNDALPDVPVLTTDLASQARIYNVQTDMGAYEMQSVPGAGTLPASGEQATLPVYAGATAITSNCKTFGLIEPTGTPGALGNVTVKTFLATGNTVSEGTKVFVKRHYDISPSGTDGPAKVTLYFSKQDFDTYNQAYGNANNATLPANLKVVQYHGTSPYGFPGTYSGPTQLITNVTVTPSEDQTMYLVTFPVTGFSGFFVTGQPESALPVTLVSFQARKRENQAYLQWQTSSEFNSSHFNVERSRDGRLWEQLGYVQAQGGQSVKTDYSYTDALPMAGTNMYRLKMIDRAENGEEGSFAYSRIVTLDFGAEAPTLYPNPAVSTVHLKGIPAGDVRTASILDLWGTNLGTQPVRNGAMEVSGLKPGSYTVEIVRTNGEKVLFRLAVAK
ncbi:hypothetical protein GCM10010967_30930 [Dyadobacter beijingensis]|uniref:Right handed beta helix domain-containing protein n=1 Tax=Dyadobacter beijingensis TaxID=365489 RepID=A0ABQ2HZI2_9BACT|nr:hypothetical protein GCM10010967_30930 [Dyadobacter beijingensis]